MSYTVTVPLPTAFTVMGGGFYCTGGTHVGLSGSQMGVNYQLYIDGTASGSAVAGSGYPLDFGLQYTIGTYTVVATDAASGCTNAMTGSVAVSTLSGVAAQQTAPFAGTVGETTFAYNSGGFTLTAVPTPATPPTGTTYTWNDGSGPVTGANFSPTYTPGGSAITYTVTLTATYGTCSVTTTVDIVVPPAGCSPYDYFTVHSYPGGCTGCSAVQPFHTITASALAHGVNIADNDLYYIVNTATLAGGTYTGDNFFMNSGVALNLGLATVNVLSCHFSASPNCMWRGLNVGVTSTATGQLDIENSLVENTGAGGTAGVNIINAPGGSYYSPDVPILISKNNIFNSNYTGISISGYQPASAPTTAPGYATPSALPFTITDCFFTNRDLSSSPSPTGTVPADFYPFRWPVVGTDIHLAPVPDPEDPSFDIDAYTLQPYSSTSAEGHNGIYMQNTGYSHLVSGGGPGVPAVYTYNYVLVGNNSPDAAMTKGNYFDNMFFGVQLQNANALLNDNTFRRVSNGIMVSDQWNDVEISDDPAHDVNTNNRFYSDFQFGVTVQSASLTFMLIPNDFTCSNNMFTSATIHYNHAIDLDFLSPAYPAPTYHNAHSVKNNYIYNYAEGIAVAHQTGSTTTSFYGGNTDISNNTINGMIVGGPGTEETFLGISYSDIRTYSGSHGNGNVTINNNTIMGVENGIQFNSWVDNATINFNKVGLLDYSASSSPPSPSSGMVWGLYVNQAPFLMQVQQNQLGGWGWSCNTINPITLTPYPTAGMFLSYIGQPGGTLADVSCNAVHDAVRGFEFQYADYINWHDNEMVSDNYGMYLDGGGAMIFQQGAPGVPCDDHWEDETAPCCTYTTGTCGTLWPGWGATSGTYKTYVAAGAGANFSPLYFRSDPVYPAYDISATADCGASGTSYPYGDPHVPTSLNPLGVIAGAPSGCMTLTSFKETHGTQPGSTVHAADITYNLFPNPSTGYLTITRSAPIAARVTVSVYNMLGQRVYSSPLDLSTGKAEFTMGNAAVGMYQVQLTDEKGEVWNKKVVIE